ncbi:MAG: hypothetical protein HY904_14490 [Deltaproteobacteria bacterium]|nr:hypothetical protein [Deltaproteobacteria bacterium]
MSTLLGANLAQAEPLLGPPGAAVALVKRQPAPPPDEREEDNAFFKALYKVNSFYPVVLDKDLEPEVRSKVVPLWITTVFCGPFLGPLWIPMLIVGENPGAEYFIKEALIAVVVEMAGYLLGGTTTAFAGLGSIIIVAQLLYFSPVSLIDGYDRALKRQRAKAARQDGQPNPRKRKAVR